jgi:hypothetical protein
VLVEELAVIDAASPLWGAVRPLLDAALRIEQQDSSYSWHGWRKEDINAFLKALPAHCSLLVGVWQVDASAAEMSEQLMLGCVCEVVAGEISSVRTIETFTEAGLPPIAQLEPGYDHAQELIRITGKQVAPVAWAIFTDKVTWDEWLLTDRDNEHTLDKGELLTSLTQQGRCVLLGSQVAQRRLHHL